MAKPNGLGDICEKLQSDPYVLFLITVAMFFDKTKIPTSVLCRTNQGTFIPSLILMCQVVSEEKSFVQLLMTTTDDDDNGRKVMAMAPMAFGKVS